MDDIHKRRIQTFLLSLTVYQYKKIEKCKSEKSYQVLSSFTNVDSNVKILNGGHTLTLHYTGWSCTAGIITWMKKQSCLTGMLNGEMQTFMCICLQGLWTWELSLESQGGKTSVRENIWQTEFVCFRWTKLFVKFVLQNTNTTFHGDSFICSIGFHLSKICCSSYCTLCNFPFKLFLFLSSS